MDNIVDAFEFFKYNVLNGNIKTTTNDAKSQKLMKHIVAMMSLCDDDEVHKAAIMSVFQAGFVAGEQYLCRKCKTTDKPQQHNLDD